MISLQQLLSAVGLPSIKAAVLLYNLRSRRASLVEELIL